MKHRQEKKSYLLWSKLNVSLETGPLCLGIGEEEELPLKIQYVFLQNNKAYSGKILFNISSAVITMITIITIKVMMMGKTIKMLL